MEVIVFERAPTDGQRLSLVVRVTLIKLDGVHVDIGAHCW